MTINKTQPHLINFEHVGELNGSFIGTNQFSFQLAPHHPDHGIVFVVYCDTNITGSKSGEIKFKGQVAFYFDTETHKPSLDELLELTKLGTVELNNLLANEILAKTDIVPFKIHDSHPDDSLNTLQQNLVLAP